MSARDEVVNGLSEHACCFSEEDAKRMVEAHEHELAEQIRKQTARSNLIRPEHADAWESGLDCAASLIDPFDENGEPKPLTR